MSQFTSRLPGGLTAILVARPSCGLTAMNIWTCCNLPAFAPFTPFIEMFARPSDLLLATGNEITGQFPAVGSGIILASGPPRIIYQSRWYLIPSAVLCYVVVLAKHHSRIAIMFNDRAVEPIRFSTRHMNRIHFYCFVFRHFQSV